MGARASRSAGVHSRGMMVPAPKGIKVLVWNVQGLRKDCLEERTLAVVKIIQRETPSAILFQELVPSTYTLFQEKMKTAYSWFSPFDYRDIKPRYFTGIFLNNEVFGSCETEFIRFPQSSQGRDMLIVKSSFKNCSVSFVTSHLESMLQNTKERQNQLHILYETMLKQGKNSTVVYGGDTNLLDTEFNAVVENGGFDESRVSDVWKDLGSPEELRYTWDPIVNDNETVSDMEYGVKRYDRVFLRCTTDETAPSYVPKEMRLVGKERLPCGMFCSDHWGLIMNFALESK